MRQSLLLLVAIQVVLIGCGDARQEATPEELHALDEKTAEQQRALRYDILETILQGMQAEVAAGQEPKIDILMLSGGGAKGAFGAAFLRSWQENIPADHPNAYPKFDLVSGISTGALIAPYAVIGTPERLTEAENIYREADPNWVSFSFWSTVSSGKGLANTDNLDEKMRSHFNLSLAQELSDKQLNDKQQVLTGTANLDLSRPIAWRIGDAAQKALNENDPEHLFLPLRASASIPGAFSPVIIDNQLHADGAVFGQIHVLGDIRITEYILRRWKRLQPEAPAPKVRYWIILNNILREQPTTVQPTWLSVMGRANKATYKHLVIEPMNLLSANVQLMQEKYDLDIELNWVTIPREYEFTEVDNEFSPEFTNPLADLGASMGADANAWLGIDDLGIQELDQALKAPVQKRIPMAETEDKSKEKGSTK